MDRNALNAVNQPAWEEGTKLSWGCEICDGYGFIYPHTKKDDWPEGDIWVQRELDDDGKPKKRKR